MALNAVSIGLIVFLTDLSWSMMLSTLSLYAKFLGASVALSGVVVSGVGISRTLGTVPLGVLSDKVGRKTVIVLGLALSFLASISFIVVFDPVQLIPAAMILALGTGSVFTLGYAYVADFTTSTKKGKAVGLYATFMGIGFSIGPFVAGFISQNWGYPFTYITSSFLFSASLVVAWGTLRKEVGSKSQFNRSTRSNDLLKNLGSVMKRKELLVAFVGSFFYGIGFAAIFGFFPLFAQQAGFSLVIIGFIISVRNFSSSLVRSPVGMLTHRIGNFILMIVALGSTGIALLMIPFFNSYYALLTILAFEGSFYGIFLISSNTLVVEASHEREMGTAVSMLSTLEFAGSAIGPLIFGAVGQLLGLERVFSVTSLLLIAGAVFLGANSARISWRRKTDGEADRKLNHDK
jgi:DHA1 family multidrug resistance protein-like MFS transporter